MELDNIKKMDLSTIQSLVKPNLNGKDNLQKNSLEIECRKRFTPQEAVQIQGKLYELAKSKSVPIEIEAIKEFINEFENLQLPLNDILTRIENVKYVNTYGAVKFNDFVNQENIDELIPQTQIYRKAMSTIATHQDKFRLFCQEYYGTTLISREQITKILELLNKNEISHYDLQSAKKNNEWLKGENERIDNMKKGLFDKKEEVREILTKIINDAYENSEIPADYKKTSAENSIYLCIKDLNKYL